jgi:hypothetical protein
MPRHNDAGQNAKPGNRAPEHAVEFRFGKGIDDYCV